MNNLVKGTFFAVLLTTFLTSCNKDQSCINKLDGTWEMTDGKTTKNGTEVVDTTQSDAKVTYTFSKFKLKDEDEGSVSIKTVATTPVSINTTTSAKYKVSDKCDKFWWSTSDTTTTDDITADISSLSSKKFEFTYSQTMGSDNYKYTVILEKQ